MKTDKIIYRFTDEKALYAAYMPYISGGGLFIPTSEPFALGDFVVLNIQLLDELEMLETKSKVVWITPKGAQANRTSGIGVQLQDEKGLSIRNKIETYLAGMLNSGLSNDTF